MTTSMSNSNPITQLDMTSHATLIREEARSPGR